ncbi:MAG TPA: hypothetical protein PLD47_06040 [Aggregatilineales bacterium]|nr:hypothetical protein [Anaerolineales bacterium]HRE47269.1 hypothetical protein [Aggregatilineales bacterium]
MSRVINPDSVGKERNQLMRTAAELLRRLSQKTEIDDEAKDMVAALVYCFRGIEDGIEASMVAWEKRNYWNKVEQFRNEWIWVGSASARLTELIRNGAWDALPAQMVTLLPRFASISISKFTRDASSWQGAFAKLTAETPPAKPTLKA